MFRAKVLITNLFTASGGGTRTTLSIVRSLAEAGFPTDLISFWGLDLKTLEKLHGIVLNDLVSRGLLRIYYRFQHKIFTSLRYLSYEGFKNLVRKFVKTGLYDALFFFDDILKIKELLESDKPVFLYIHFSYVHRILTSLFENLTRETECSKLEVLKERIIRTLLSNLFIVNPRIPRNITVLVNSTVTLLFTRSLWSIDPILLHPPVMCPLVSIEPAKLFDQKKDVIISIGAFEPTKRFDIILEAFAKSRAREKAKLILIGSPDNLAYLRYLQKKAFKLGIAERVRFLTNLSDEKKWNILLRSKIIVHAKIFEPFGIAVAEGMHAGCIPIVYRGALSGPWIDLINEGKYGFGFKDVDELANMMDNILLDYDKMKTTIDAIVAKSLVYSYKNFKEKLLEIFKTQLT